MDRAGALTYAARVVGVVVFAIGIGGAVLGVYAPLQSGLDLCGHQTVQVTPALGGDDASNQVGPERLAFDDLSTTEQGAFEAGLDARTGETDVGYGLEHQTTLRRGAVVTYRGNDYQFAVISENRCVEVAPAVLPVGLVGVLLGGAIYGLPSLRRVLR